MEYKVYSRYNAPQPYRVKNVTSKHLTEQGLVIPLSKLVQMFTQGKEVPHLLGSIASSVPFGNSFDSDIIQKFKQFKMFENGMQNMRDLIDKSSKQIPTA